jgi:DNA-binding CsgD family transcriptional regulator
MSQISGWINEQEEASNAANLAANHDFDSHARSVSMPEPISSPALQPIGKQLLKAASGFPDGWATELANGAVGRDLAGLCAASLAGSSAWTSLLSVDDELRSACQNAGSAAHALLNADLILAGSTMASALQEIPTGSTVISTMDLGLASWRDAVTAAMPIRSPLDGHMDAASTAMDNTVAALSDDISHLWSDVADIRSHLISGVEYSLPDPFDLLSSVRETINLAALPLADYEHLLPPPGSFYADFDLLEDTSAKPEERLAAVQRMADRIEWYPRKRAVQRALAQQATAEQTSVAQICHRELCAAVLLVLDDKDYPKTHRFGKDWVTGEDGRKVAVAPTELPMDFFWDWFFTEVPKAAEASILGRPYPPVTGDAMVRAKDGVPLCQSLNVGRHDPTDADGDPLLALLETERRAEEHSRLLAALQVASPRQRQLLALLAAGFTEAEAARRLGIKPATARAQLARLRRKVV